MRFQSILVLICVFCSACRGPLPRGGGRVGRPAPVENGRSLVLVNSARLPDFVDDGDRAGLITAAKQSADYFRALPSGRKIAVGGDTYSAREMAESLDYFRNVIASGRGNLKEILQRDFKVYASVGSDGQGTVVFSSYYEHSLQASLQRTSRYQYPLYGRPADLEEITENGERKVVRRGRPYFTREEIDSGKVLGGQGLEIAWADNPVDIFFLQVQGSGWLLLPNGERLRIRYAGNNGHPFKSVGGYMMSRGILPKEKFSRQAMVDYLASHPDERQTILNANPRYVFFKIDKGPTSPWAYGSLNVPLTPGRSVAMDPAVFPPGALAWMESQGKSKVRRFVLNQDEGGAIKGPARVDYFAGSGDDAEKFAIGFWEKGRLYFLVKTKRP
jgi:membrane-bound lytic murein transglycosylase A